MARLNDPNRSLFSAITIAYLFLVSFTQLWNLPLTHAAVQAAEVVFIPLGAMAISRYGWQLFSNRAVTLPLLAYVLVNFAAAAASGQPEAVLEALGRFYLAFMFLVFWTYSQQEGDALKSRLIKAWYSGALVLSIFTVFAYLLALGGYLTPLVHTYSNYPYFGAVIRAVGFTNGPGMLIVVLAWPTLWVWYLWRRQEGLFWPLIFLLGALLLTLSKEILLICLGLFLLDPKTESAASWKKSGAVLMVTLLFLIGSHLFISSTGTNLKTPKIGQDYHTNTIWWSSGGVQVTESSYLALKRANWIVGCRHPWLGVGPGLFNREIAGLQREGLHPAGLPAHDPHFTWGGAWSETGILGLIALLYLSTGWGKKFWSYPTPTDQIWKVTQIFMLLMLINSMTMDVMNIRQLWLAAAIGLIQGNAKEG